MKFKHVLKMQVLKSSKHDLPCLRSRNRCSNASTSNASQLLTLGKMIVDGAVEWLKWHLERLNEGELVELR